MTILRGGFEIMAKKYKLHCFGCGNLFYNKEEVYRRDGMPYCEECYTYFLIDQEEMERYEWEMKKWHDDHPGVDYEQYQIDQANIARYGEY